MQIETPEHTDIELPVTTTLNAIFAPLELSRSKWLVTSLLPGGSERMSKHTPDRCEGFDLVIV
ncbi:MAG: hypothetical protein Q8L53_17285 [Aestuariivirga sp.]|nr:hypothetical protein [Aestuariivirga sp.]